MPASAPMIPGGVFFPSQVEAVRSYLDRLVAARRSKQADPASNLAAEEQEWVARLVSKPTITDAESALHAVTTLTRQAPIFELSFATQPSTELLTSLVSWFRGHVNPLILIRVNIQPGLIGGFTVRTSRHVYDMSVAAAVEQGHTTLREAVHGW